METISYWTIFFSAAFAINISPGPDLIYILSKTICPKLLDEAAYPLLTPDRSGNWEESRVPFLLG